MEEADLNLRHLRLFSRICELGSLNRVAAQLNISQPSISVAIAGIEAQFGAKLLSRHATGSQPTPAGEVLRRRFDRMDNQFAAALGQALGTAAQRDATLVARCLDRITMRHIKALIALANAGSITEAARRNDISPGGLHRLVQGLQANVGRAILARGPTGVTPNAIGRNLALRWQVALTEIDQARDELHELEGRLEGRIKVASLPLARTLLLARAINPLLAAHPNARIEVVDGSYELLSQQLRAGATDILIGALRSGGDLQGLHAEPLFNDPYAIVGRPGHALLGLGRGAELDELASMDWVAQRPGTPIRAAFDVLFEEYPAPPRANVETSSLVLTRAILMESDRLAMLSRRQIAIEDREGILRCIPVSPDVERLLGARTIGVTMREDWLPSRLQRTFLKHLRAAGDAIAK
ncbi:LysR family transcriptional regulator [Mesorhizobium sp. WSM2239]|uniref:LysR family transcriptional regulator n=2 Tax=unclassified Mesorhizobium TaxID=325217 RepID=A0AAU8DE02_9HYPH